MAQWPMAPDLRAGAAHLAWLLQVQMDTAQAQGKAVVGVSFDWSKAFDRVPLQLLQHALEQAAVPLQYARPLLATYGADRRLRVAGAQGAAWSPTCGVLLGCPLAVFALALLVRPWQCKVQAINPGIRERAYVDDLLAWMADDNGDEVEPLVAMDLVVRLTHQLASDFAWRLNDGKVALWATEGRLRQRLREC